MKSPGINYLLGLGLSGKRGKSHTNGETAHAFGFWQLSTAEPTPQEMAKKMKEMSKQGAGG
jgi:hypothetical protein